MADLNVEVLCACGTKLVMSKAQTEMECWRCGNKIARTLPPEEKLDEPKEEKTQEPKIELSVLDAGSQDPQGPTTATISS